MKVILYIATTVNGFIAQKDDDTSFISKEEWASYSTMVKTAGNVVLGHRTYDIITKQPEFQEFSNIKIIIVASESFKTLDKNHVVVDSPQKALDSLNNFQNVIVAGGGSLNTSFLKENLIDEIYLDIEPVLLNQGIPLVNGFDFQRNLKFLETRQISENEIQLHYKVIK